MAAVAVLGGVLGMEDWRWGGGGGGPLPTKDFLLGEWLGTGGGGVGLPPPAEDGSEES